MHSRIIFSIVTTMALLNVVAGYFAFTEPPDYLISISPEVTSLGQGDSAQFSVTLASLRGFNAYVTLRVAAKPEGVEAGFTENVTRVTGEQNVTVTVDVKVRQEAPAGLYELVIEGNSGGLVHTATEQVNIIGTGRVIVFIRDFWFYPDNLTIRKGTEVTWVNMDLTGHTATADQGEFDSKMLQQNQRYTFTFNQLGRYSYYCVPHPQMVGVVRVVD